MVKFRIAAVAAAVAATAVITSTLGQAAPLLPNRGVLFSDQTADGVFLTRDLNDDGDAGDAGETTLYFGAGNASGLPQPTSNVFTIMQKSDLSVLVGDGNTDTVYRLRDLNKDGDAQDAGEAKPWFSASNSGGLPLQTPNGLAQGSDGAVYVVEADTVGNPNGDFVYRTVDKNGDGDANDAGEASTWLKLNDLSPTSSPFEIDFVDKAAFVIDSNGINKNVIYRAEDTDGSGSVEVAAGEAKVFIDEDNPFGVPLDFALATTDDSVLTLELLDTAGPQSIFRLTDLDGSGDINGIDEILEIWNSTLAPEAFPPFVAFSIDELDGDLFFTSNGGDPNEDTIYRLTDLNGDGDYLDPGETIVWLSRELSGDLPIRPRAVAGIRTADVPEPALLSLFGIGLAGLGLMRRRRSM